MKNILVAIDVLHPNQALMEFGCYLARVLQSRLTGVFLENLVYINRPVVKSMYGSPYIETVLATDVEENVSKRKSCQETIDIFIDICQRKDVVHRVHIDRGIPAESLIEESRFADILIVDAETTFSKKIERTPTRFVTDILAESECPVIISPDNFNDINEIIFAYDGLASAMYALKLFTYLFPQFSDKKIEAVEINKESDAIIKERRKLSEWLKLHYTNTGLQILHGEPAKELLTYLSNKKDSWVVTGAYGRNWLSTAFAKSKARFVVEYLDLPIFIAHC